jgi:hypothetical protein
MSGAAYGILQATIISHQGSDSILKQAVGSDWKAKISLGTYLLAIVAGHWEPNISLFLYAVVTLIWIVPDPRIERMYHVK